MERELLRRRQTGMIGGVAAIVWAIIQIVISAFNANYLKNIDEFVIYLVSGRWGELIGAEGL